MRRGIGRRKKGWVIFFDVGGVLLADFIDRKVIDLARKYRKDPALLLQVRKKLRPLADAGKLSDEQFWQALLQHVGVSATAEDYEIISYMHDIPQMMALVAKLKQKGYPLAILSNDSKEMFAEKRSRFHFDELFDEVIVSNEHGVVKPWPEIYQIALKRMNVKPQNAILIDDRLENVATAQQLGMWTILHRNYQQTEEQLRKLGVIL